MMYSEQYPNSPEPSAVDNAREILGDMDFATLMQTAVRFMSEEATADFMHDLFLGLQDADHDVMLDELIDQIQDRYAMAIKDGDA